MIAIEDELRELTENSVVDIARILSHLLVARIVVDFSQIGTGEFIQFACIMGDAREEIKGLVTK